MHRLHRSRALSRFRSMNRRVIAVAAAISILAIGGATTVFAAVVTPDGVIQACVSDFSYNGIHGVVLTDSTCPLGTTSLNWNQKGPKGDTGASGAAGAQGPAGPAGAAGPAGPA